RVELLAAGNQYFHRLLARALRALGIHLQGRIDFDAALFQRARVAAIAFEEFRIVARCGAEERDAPAALLQQVFGNRAPALEVVAADRDVGRLRLHRSPAHETGAAGDQLFQPIAVGEVI